MSDLLDWYDGTIKLPVPSKATVVFMKMQARMGELLAKATGIPKHILEGDVTKYDPNNVRITVGGVEIDPKGYDDDLRVFEPAAREMDRAIMEGARPKKARPVSDGRPRWQCDFCGAVNMANDWIAACRTCHKIGCHQCMVPVDLHFEHMEME